jgi:hypothetical protein
VPSQGVSGLIHELDVVALFIRPPS